MFRVCLPVFTSSTHSLAREHTSLSLFLPLLFITPFPLAPSFLCDLLLFLHLLSAALILPHALCSSIPLSSSVFCVCVWLCVSCVYKCIYEGLCICMCDVCAHKCVHVHTMGMLCGYIGYVARVCVSDPLSLLLLLLFTAGCERRELTKAYKWYVKGQGTCGAMLIKADVKKISLINYEFVTSRLTVEQIPLVHYANKVTSDSWPLIRVWFIPLGKLNF